MYSPADLEFMQLALDEARKASFISNPNPRVGCVIVKDNQVIGHGHTQMVGGPHAEVQALANAKAQGHSVEGATVYVTLEPCCHHGRTPPCTDALINSKVAKVIAANKVVDWDTREAVQARLRNVVRVVLRKYGYPQALREQVADQVLVLAKLTDEEGITS